MAHEVATALPGLGFPARASFASGAAGVESEAGDGHKNVAISDVDGDPFAFALFTVFEIAARGHRAIEKARFPQNVGNGAGAIVARVAIFGMAAPPFVGHGLQAISGGDGTLHGRWCASRSVGDTILDHRRASVFEMIRNGLAGFHLAGTRHQSAAEGYA